MGGGLPSLNNTYGAVLRGTFFGLILYGLFIHQVYRYSRLDFEDSLWTKCYVAFILTLHTFHVILGMHMWCFYFYLVKHQFEPTFLFTRVLSIDPLRAQSMAHPKLRPLVVLAVVFSMGELDATIQASVLPVYLELRQLTWLLSIAFGLVVVSDILVTSSPDSRKRTPSLTSSLHIVSTALLPDIFKRPQPLVYLNTNSMVYIALDIVVTKLYTNSVIGTLNFGKTLAQYKFGGANHVIGLTIIPQSGGSSSSAPGFASSGAY
ncbi:hypothetical protein BD413DRAFT_617640 [Trametes elegans]|nr:hypothetical protein BD413DRAFT_617640 [Trametes elegans]